MPWFDGRLAAYDCETTGVDVEEDRIVTACLVQVGANQPMVRSDWLVNPGVEIPEDASAVHGITTERAQTEGQPAPSAVSEIAFGLTRTIKARIPIIVYHAPFDLTVLDRECRRHGLEPPSWAEAFIVDPLVIWKWADRFRRGSRNLAAACECFGVELGDAHDAGADALAVARVAWKMMHKTDLVQGRRPEIIQRRAFWKAVRDDPARLMECQREWATEQANGLRSYFEGRGEHEKAATVHGAWPWVPFEARTEVGA